MWKTTQFSEMEHVDESPTQVKEVSEEVGSVSLDRPSMEKIADIMLERFSNQILDQLADRVAQKVLRGLLNTGGEE